MLQKSIAAIIGLSKGKTDAVKYFTLYDYDVNGAYISYALYANLRGTINPLDNTEIMYHASCFVTAVHRVSRMHELMVSKKNLFEDPIANTIKLEWNKKRKFYESFKDPRNAIEHIDKDSKKKTQTQFYNFHKDKFNVTKSTSVSVNEMAIKKLLSSHTAICDEIIKYYNQQFGGILSQMSNIFTKVKKSK
jgi:hypothetical protein